MRRLPPAAILPALLLLLLAVASRMLPAFSAPAWEARVDGWVLNRLEAEGEAEFLVYLQAQADLSGAQALTGKGARGAHVAEQLTATAARTQPAVIAELERLGAAYRPFWVANMIWVRGDREAVERLARRADVAHLYANPRVRMPALPPERAPLAPAAVETGVALIGAPDVWAMGITGEGAVIAGQDTGYAWEHPALQDQYRGWNGSSASHGYNWHDAIHGDLGGTPAGNPCGFNSPEPCDDGSHGTHTMGTMVGDDGGPNQIGVAPGARWIGCRNMEQGWGTPATYSECFQWFIAPTDQDGLNADPGLAPDVINNSWTCTPGEGCTDPNLLLSVVENTRAAGIVVASAAGNSGPSCGSINQPPGHYDAAFTVGATDFGDMIAGFSGRGPVSVDGSNRLKPDVTAPGVGVRSSVPPAGYGISSGTSMATPHVSGLVALLVQARPDLRGNVESIEMLIRQAAVPLTGDQGCGGDGPADVPNNVYGYGRIDALSAVSLALEFAPQEYLPLTASD
jgi:subtilisin family serine protease